jgi:hypothetical protein
MRRTPGPGPGRGRGGIYRSATDSKFELKMVQSSVLFMLGCERELALGSAALSFDVRHLLDLYDLNEPSGVGMFKVASTEFEREYLDGEAMIAPMRPGWTKNHEQVVRKSRVAGKRRRARNAERRSHA